MDSRFVPGASDDSCDCFVMAALINDGPAGSDSYDSGLSFTCPCCCMLLMDVLSGENGTVWWLAIDACCPQRVRRTTKSVSVAGLLSVLAFWCLLERIHQRRAMRSGEERKRKRRREREFYVRVCRSKNLLTECLNLPFAHLLPRR